jgi:hypothetical protein
MKLHFFGSFIPPPVRLWSNASVVIAYKTHEQHYLAMSQIYKGGDWFAYHESLAGQAWLP